MITKYQILALNPRLSFHPVFLPSHHPAILSTPPSLDLNQKLETPSLPAFQPPPFLPLAPSHILPWAISFFRCDLGF